jgi:hypothetical protein
MDHELARVEALEQQVHRREWHTQAIARRVRWWRTLACSLRLPGLVSWVLPLGLTLEMSTPEGPGGLALRLAALTHKQRHLTGATDEAGCLEVVLRGTNLRAVSGLGRAGCAGESGEPIPDCPNGVSNPILRANEPRAEGFNNLHTGSLYVVAGKECNLSHVGGLVVGLRSARRGDFAAGYRGRAPRPAERAFNWAAGPLFADE